MITFSANNHDYDDVFKTQATQVVFAWKRLCR